LSIYARNVSHLKTLDPYRLQELYHMHPCAEHVVKKLLVAGKREGAKDLDTDISDCIRTLTRWQEMRAEDAGTLDVTRDSAAVPRLEVATPGDTRYPWNIAPDWAQFAATDPNGKAHWYNREPKVGIAEWLFPTSAENERHTMIMGRSFPVEGWQDSLEARPA